MLARNNRISKKLFKEVYKKGKRINNPLLILIFYKSNFKESRISFAVPISISKKSAVRNKLKRRVKYIFLKNKNIVKDYYDIIVIFKKEALKLNFKDLEKELLKVFRT